MISTHNHGEIPLLLDAKMQLDAHLMEMNEIWDRSQGNPDGDDLFRLMELFCAIVGELSLTKGRLEHVSSTDEHKDDRWVEMLNYHAKELIRLTPQLTDQTLVNEAVKMVMEQIDTYAGDATPCT